MISATRLDGPPVGAGSDAVVHLAQASKTVDQQAVEQAAAKAPVAEQASGKSAAEPAEPVVASDAAAATASGPQVAPESGRKMRSDQAAAKPVAEKSAPSSSAQAESGKPAAAVSTGAAAALAAKTAADQQRQAAASSKSSAQASNKLSGKSGSSSASAAAATSATGKKLPANLGTVTSTGSGGPAHYMSKHDAYSAIAEKHGALAQDAIRKVDKRPSHGNLQRFGSIQKASGFTDSLNPFKTVTDGGLARSKYLFSSSRR